MKFKIPTEYNYYTNQAKFQKIPLLIVSILITTSCSTLTKSTLLGAGIGATTGGLMGSLINRNGSDDDKTKGLLVGAAVGAAAGGLVGYYGHKQLEEKNNEVQMPRLENQSKDSKVPKLTVPEVRKVWVPDKIEGNKYEEGHYIYVIERSSVWSN